LNYAFAPGVSRYDIQSRHLLDDRPGTVLISAKSIKHIEAFLLHLKNTAAIPKPIGGDLYLGSHGNHKAWMHIDIDGTKPVNTTYEVVEQAISSGSVMIPLELNHNTDGSESPINIHIRGCLIGVAEPFVDKLRNAFAGAVTVTAPRHFHIVFPGDYPNKLKGMLEYLKYAFRLVRRDPFKSKAEAVTAFSDEGFTYIDEKTTPNIPQFVPDDRWNAWIPRKVNKKKKVFSASMPLGQKVGGAKVLTDSTGREFRHGIETFIYTLRGQTAPPPVNQRVDLLRESLDQDARFATTHPYPMQVRFGHETRDQFVEGLKWRFTWDKKKKVLICVGKQHAYVVLVPLAETAADPPGKPPVLPSGNLLFNFYPHPASSGSVVETMPTSDDRLFYTSL
jgi:hypothetical protein